MTTTNELSVTPNLVVSRESFEKAVEELVEDAMVEGRLRFTVGRAPGQLDEAIDARRAARGRLLQLWDEREKEWRAESTALDEVVPQIHATNKALAAGWEWRKRAERAEAEVERLRDDPECDATDLAHPAWWRGNDAGVHATVEVIRRVLDSGLDGGVSGYKPLQEIRERVERLRESQRDTERLDWLDDRENFYAITPATNMIGGPHGWTYYVGRPRFNSIGERCFDLRDAIDKARLKSGSPREERSE